MKKSFYLKRNVYIMLLSVILLALAVQLSRSQYILQFSKNNHLLESHRITNQSPGMPIAFSGPAYCVVYDERDAVSVKVKNNVMRALQYMKKKTESTNIAQQSLVLKGCSVTIITSFSLSELGDMNKLSSFVQDGGYMMFARTLEQDEAYYQIYRKLGITASSESKQVDGIKLDKNVLIGEKGLSVGSPFVLNEANVVELDESSEVLASSGSGVPLLWRSDYGKGAFMVLNGTMLVEKINRGLFTGAISMLEPDYIYPVFNAKLMFIDDFPAPIRKGNLPSIYEEYHRDIPRFYHDIWWPDMLKTATKTGLKYTAVLIQSYNDQVMGDFSSPIDEERYNLISYGREVMKSGGEIGIHGYNHQSLQTSQVVADNYGYKSWKSVDEMSASIKEALKYANNAFPKYDIVSYVPPSNEMDAVGREALKKAWPNLTVISSIYEEDATNMSYIQEYEVAKDGIIEFPRMTSGYIDNEVGDWIEANAITSLGVFSHFVHPDDVISEDRNMNLTWSKLYEGFSEKMNRVQRTYPWLRARTAAEAGIDMEKVLNASVTWTREGDSIQGAISNFQADQYFVLRTKKSILKTKSCDVSKIDDNTFLVKASSSKFEIRLDG
ncbi:DUF2194 domain-containing protein [Paenibacillus sacheonensis]|uniref:DUF2194 domain-containing protein n=1 Tax=Paenibacillus sacheonensis TaxID=742054 RepID=A0A7X5BYW1_9BACL|nr:DUF2194 domain-containing protein [Paenibacillus sacheonensis]MBM7567706.1 hypothetical protein [Paenibacillus sacheonensis]NBC72018.1 DUF2194 domain-containing protein [Paenibacillus sacheonensis]